MKLDARLRMMSSMHSQGKNFADVGTDHAYVPIALLEKDSEVRCIASDIHQGPLNVAMDNAKEANLKERMTFILADGLDGLPLEEEQVKEIFICGMGGETILSILENCSYIRKNDVHLFLQPMTKIPDVRRYLASSGFKTEQEKLATDGKRIYVGMDVYYTGESCEITEFEARIGKKLLENGKSETLLPLLLKKELEKVQTKMAGKCLGGYVEETDVAFAEELKKRLEDYQ